MSSHRQLARHGRRHIRGLGLVELMISLVLGLIVVGAAGGIFLSNQQTYRATENLGRIQENARIAFELMAREVREAGGNACSKGIPVANVLKNSAANWWSNWGNGVLGYDNGALAGSAAGTDAIELMSSTSSGVSVTEHTPHSAQFKVNTKDHGIEDGDVLMVCDYTQASIFQVSNANSTNVTIVHNTGLGNNCTKALGLPLPPTCGAPKGEVWKTYNVNSTLAKLEAARWYVADNGRGGRSLYRVRMDKAVAQPAEEITEGVRDMQIEYLRPGTTSYVAAGAVAAAEWPNINAVRITLGLEGGDRVGTDAATLKRTLVHVVTLRNRNA